MLPIRRTEKNNLVGLTNIFITKVFVFGHNHTYSQVKLKKDIEPI